MKHMGERWAAIETSLGWTVQTIAGVLLLRINSQWGLQVGRALAYYIADAHNAALDAAADPKADAPASVAPVGSCGGISRRDIFAAAALAGMLADNCQIGTHKDFAEHAVRYADAMLAAEKEGAK